MYGQEEGRGRVGILFYLGHDNVMMTRGASGPATPLLLAWSCVAGWSPVLFGVDGVIAVISTRQHTHPRTSCSFGFPFLHCSSSHTSSPILAFGLVISHLGHIRKFFTHGRDVSPSLYDRMEKVKENVRDASSPSV